MKIAARRLWAMGGALMAKGGRLNPGIGVATSRPPIIRTDLLPMKSLSSPWSQSQEAGEEGQGVSNHYPHLCHPVHKSAQAVDHPL